MNELSQRLHLLDQKNSIFELQFKYYNNYYNLNPSNHSNMLICCSRNTYYYYQCIKQLC